MDGSTSPAIRQEKSGGAAVRRAVLSLSAFLLRNRIVFLLTIVFCAAMAGTLWHLSRLSSIRIECFSWFASDEEM